MASGASGNNDSRQTGSGRSSRRNGESSSSAEAVLEFKVQPPSRVIPNRSPPYAIIVGLTPPRRVSDCLVELFLHDPAGNPVGRVNERCASERVLQDVGIGCYIFPRVKLDAPVGAWYYLRASFRVLMGDRFVEMYSVYSDPFLLAPGEPSDEEERQFYRQVYNAGFIL
ncbi:hypothetical protein DL766_007739 [Monosporascus sp. MC13-8B]|uniref:Velvet domain-containing protein n=1 Tax=Monosporascus cannonballus TaxID=155416 RepID=A0ABY0HFK1_9PEZI|nr:hypothetical protein DL763_010878 [Monosporascus cannonballus]RYO89361.1 hypothetical protein DL762_003252 [Monosporascus cannonballus]RYP22421.1 hypothetical protein DL766_007739 [Monosporascus sp. MC13-8B]